ncbi:MAG: hypothetical protein ABIM89_15955, partial [Mycobacteriales bacterium]
MRASRFRLPSRLAAVTVGTVMVISGAAPARAADTGYTKTDLVADETGTTAQVVDTSLVNAWGMSQGPASPVWVSSAEKHVSVLYSGATATTVT